MIASDKYDDYALHLRNQRRRYDNGLPSSHKPEDIVYWERNPEDLAWFLSNTDDELTKGALAWANKELFPWMKSHGGKYPNKSSKDPVEKCLSSKLANMRENKKTSSAGWLLYGPEMDKLAKKWGYPLAFNRIDRTKEILDWAKELFQWMDVHDGKAPSMEAKDPVENALGKKLSSMRASKKDNKHGWPVYGSKLMELAKKCGYLDVFNRIDRIRDALEWAKELFQWMDVHGGRTPGQKAKDLVEKALGSKLSKMRNNKKNNQQGWPVYGSKLMELAKKCGYFDVFNTIDLTSDALEWTDKELFPWLKAHGGKFPRGEAKDPVEKALGKKLSRMRANKKNNQRGWPIYGSKLMRFVKQHGYPNVFDTRSIIC